MVDILAFGAHPDDVELSCSGTILKHISLGYSVGLVDLTQGELGSRGSVELRMEEAENSRIHMGAAFRTNLRLADGFFTKDKVTLIKVARQIRLHQPRIVLANAKSDRHPDHGKGADLVADACFIAGLVKVDILDEEGNLLPPHRPNAVYHYIQDRNMEADLVVDITGFFQKKMECVAMFKSQFFQESSTEPDTPISSKTFWDFLDAKNRTYARDINATHAEAFNVNRNIGVNDLFDLI